MDDTFDELFGSSDADMAKQGKGQDQTRGEASDSDVDDFDAFLESVLEKAELNAETVVGRKGGGDDALGMGKEGSGSSFDDAEFLSKVKGKRNSSKTLSREMRNELSLGQEFDWMFDDEEGDLSGSRTGSLSGSPTGSPVGSPKGSEKARSLSIYDLEQDAEFEMELITSLSAELQRTGQNKSAILQLCRRIGFVYGKQRSGIWLKLLDISDETSSSMNLSDIIGSPTSPRQNSSNSGGGRSDSNSDSNSNSNSNSDSKSRPSDQQMIVSAMAESAILRNAAIVKKLFAGQEEAISKEEEWISREQAALIERLSSRLVATMNAMGVDASMCDPGLADVVLLLCSPLVDIPAKYVPRVVLALQRARVLLLQFPWEDAEAIHVLSMRAKLLENVIQLHDKEVWAYVTGIAPAQVMIPWRWWRCAFAGEVSVSSLLVLWDLLIIDALPESHGDQGPSTLSSHTGLWEGCDPRGPLVVYVIAVLLMRSREKILSSENDKPDPNHCLGILRGSIAQIPTSEALILGEQAKVLRASTPFSVVEGVFEDVSIKTDKPHKIQSEISASAATSQDPKPKGRQSFSSVSHWFGGKSKKSKEPPTEPEEPKKESDKKDATPKGWLGFTRLSPRRQRASSDSKKDALADRVKLTLGIGEASAARLKEKQDTEENYQRQVRERVSEFITLVDLEKDCLNGWDNSGAENDSSDEDERESNTNTNGQEQEDEEEQTQDMEKEQEFKQGKELKKEQDQEQQEQEQHISEGETSRKIAETMLAISGLQRGSLFSATHLSVLTQPDSWVMLPIYRGKSFKTLSLLLITNYRLIVLGAPGLRELFAGRAAQSTNEARDLPQLLGNISLVVKHAWHLSQLLQVVLYPRRKLKKKTTSSLSVSKDGNPSTSRKQKIKLSFRGECGEYRLFLRHQDAHTLLQLVQSLAAQLYI